MKQTLYKFLSDNSQSKCTMQFDSNNCTFNWHSTFIGVISKEFNSENETKIELIKIDLLNDVMKIVFRPESTFELKVILKPSVLKQKLIEKPYDEIILNDSYFNVMDKNNAREIRMGIKNDSIYLYYSLKGETYHFHFENIENIDYL